MNQEWLKENQLAEIQLKDYELYYQYTNRSLHFTGIWATNFSYIWALSKKSGINVYWKIIDNMLVTFVIDRKNYMFIWCLPFGRGKARQITGVLIKAIDMCRHWNQLHSIRTPPTIHLVNERQLEDLQFPSDKEELFRFKEWKGKDVFWDIHQLVDLSGSSFSTLRYKINRLKKEYPTLIIRHYTASDYHSILKLKKAWNRTSGKKYKSITDEKLFSKITKSYRDLNEILLVAEHEGRIVGIAGGAIVPNQLAWGSIGKTLPEYAGLSETLYIELIKVIHDSDPEVRLINAGSDNNHPGLMAYKDKFRPVMKLSKYTLIPNF